MKAMHEANHSLASLKVRFLGVLVFLSQVFFFSNTKVEAKLVHCLINEMHSNFSGHEERFLPWKTEGL